MDKYVELVGNAVDAVRSTDEGRISAAFEALGPLDAEELVLELFNWVEDVTSGKNVDRLLAGAKIPLPDEPRVLIAAVANNDLASLGRYAAGDFTKLIATMVLLIASLQEAGERLG